MVLQNSFGYLVYFSDYEIPGVPESGRHSKLFEYAEIEEGVAILSNSHRGVFSKTEEEWAVPLTSIHKIVYLQKRYQTEEE